MGESRNGCRKEQIMGQYRIQEEATIANQVAKLENELVARKTSQVYEMGQMAYTQVGEFIITPIAYPESATYANNIVVYFKGQLENTVAHLYCIVESEIRVKADGESLAYPYPETQNEVYLNTTLWQFTLTPTQYKLKIFANMPGTTSIIKNEGVSA